VSWSGTTNNTYFAVEERVNGGSWSSVYQGGGTAVTLSGRPKAILAYRVRSCRTSSTCSGYRTGPSVAVNPRQLVNLYSKYPILSTIDQRVAAYKATVPSFPSVLPRAPVGGRSGAGTARIDPNEQRFYLGDGFDVIRGGLKDFCLDVNHPALTISRSPPLQPSTFDVSHVTDNRHLADLLEVSASARAGVTDDDFALGLSGEKERYLKSVSDETHERLVVKFVQRAELWRLSTPTDAINPDLTNQMLMPNSDPAKADFREHCGDKFINAVNLGAALYLVFDFDSKKFDRNERQAKKGQLGVAIGEIFSGNVAGSISTSTQLLLSQLNIKIHADQVGGPPGLAASITATNFAAKYNEFVQSLNSGNWAVVDYTTTSYPRPTVYSAYTHAQIFADFTAPFAQARRWLDLTVQLKERCDPYGENSRPRPAHCGTSETELGIALDLCRETLDWAMCQHPAQYVPAFSTMPNVFLLGWMNDAVKKVNPADLTQSYAFHVHTGSLTVDQNTCLPRLQCFVNKFRGSRQGIGLGFTPLVTYYDNPKGTGPVYSLVLSESCVKTSAYLETRRPPFGDTTADLNYTMTIEGFCADTEAFTVVQ